MPGSVKLARHERWLSFWQLYGRRHILCIGILGFASGLPLLLVTSTLAAWFADGGMKVALLGLLAFVQVPYALKFFWAPLFDTMAPPFGLGRRRGWGIAVQISLMIAIMLLGAGDPRLHLGWTTGLALVVGFLSASQDIIIDGYRVERLSPEEQGAGAAVTLAGYRLGMLMGGAGVLLIADGAGWQVAYGVAAMMLLPGVAAFYLSREVDPVFAGSRSPLGSWHMAVVSLLKRRGIMLFLVFATLYKLGDAVTLTMSTPFFLSQGFNLREIAEWANIVSFPGIVAGGLAGGYLVARRGLGETVVLCGLWQALGIGGFALLAWGGHRLGLMAVVCFFESFTGGMAWASFVAILSSFCDSPAVTATQYALLSSFMALGRTLFAAPSGMISSHIGWPAFFLGTAAVNLCSVGLFLVIRRRWPNLVETVPDGESGLSSQEA